MEVSAPQTSTKTPSSKATISIPPHIIAEAMQAKHGGDQSIPLEVRWSAPISPEEMKYVEEYVKSRYPEIYMERVVGMNLPIVDEECEDSDSDPGTSPSVRGSIEKRGARSNTSGQHWVARWGPSGASMAEEPGKALLDPSRLAEILAHNTVSVMDHSMSVTEIHARNKVMQSCGVNQEEYHIVFTASAKEALMLVAEAYPFHKHNVYMTSLEESSDPISQFAAFKEAKVISAPIVWLDLRVAGSQLSTNFRRKSKSNPKGLFAFPFTSGGLVNSLHWVSEAQRNLWHVLLDASEIVLDEHSFDLGQHKPDYLLCVSPKIVGFPNRVICLLIRRSSQAPK